MPSTELQSLYVGYPVPYLWFISKAMKWWYIHIRNILKMEFFYEIMYVFCLINFIIQSLKMYLNNFEENFLNAFFLRKYHIWVLAYFSSHSWFLVWMKITFWGNENAFKCECKFSKYPSIIWILFSSVSICLWDSKNIGNSGLWIINQGAH